MIGKTNVGGGGGSVFTAYIQISTDPSASITAVNLAGDTYSGTADSTGSLTITVHNPGTYTITESYSGMTATETVVVPDIDRYYMITVITWDGTLYDSGTEYPITGGFDSTGGIIPTRNATSIQIWCSTYTGNDLFLTHEVINSAAFTSLNANVNGVGGNEMICLFDSNNNVVKYGTLTVGTAASTSTLTIDTNGDYKYGIRHTGGNANFAIHKIWLS